MSKSNLDGQYYDQELDARTLTCPMPLLKTRQALRHMEAGDVLMVLASDAGSWADIPAYVRQSAHRLVHCDRTDKELRFWIEVGEQSDG